MKTSIVVPTYNHLEDNLFPCINSVIKYTDLSDAEIVVSANGCNDGTKEYLNLLRQSHGDAINVVWSDEALGYTKATNLGIKAARGEYIVLLNNDTVLLEQPVNHWIDLLLAPFQQRINVGVTGPQKFTWDCGNMVRTCMSFWLVMIPRAVFDRIGLLDEVFSPGMGEDGDFCARVEDNCMCMVQVPVDGSHHFLQPGEPGVFPIFHRGNGTFGDNHELKDEVIARNTALLASRYGSQLEAAYRWCASHSNDINEHFPTLRKYASMSGHVTEFGVRDVYSTIAFMAARPQQLVSYDIYESGKLPEARSLAAVEGVNFKFVKGSTLEVEIEETDMLFIDTFHVYGQLRAELERHAGKVRKFILLHDTTQFGNVGEDGVSGGLWPAVEEFLAETPEWALLERFEHNNGLTVLQRREAVQQRKQNDMIDVSIVIPTYNHCEDLLMPCVESIIKYTDLSNCEVIVVANGCTDGTREYLESLPKSFTSIWSDEALGYTKATNLGIRAARGEYIVLLNNDTMLLQQDENEWIDKLKQPFADKTVGAAGPLMLHDNYANRPVLIFFCTMVRRSMFEKFGLLDEIYSPGGGEDIDFCAKLQDAGYQTLKVPVVDQQGFDPEKMLNTGNFPIYHKGEGTFSDEEIPQYGKVIIKRNGLINAKRYNRNLRLDLGSGKDPQPGYLGVDNKAKGAHFLMDATKLEFDDNTIEEILASHLFEHLNPYKVMDVLNEWKRVLKPGGKLIMEMPDIVKLCQDIGKGDKQTRYALLNSVFCPINTTGEGDPTDITSPHLWGWCPETVWDHVSAAGFVDIVVGPEQIPHPNHNFRIECRKPAIRIGQTYFGDGR